MEPSIAQIACDAPCVHGGAVTTPPAGAPGVMRVVVVWSCGVCSLFRCSVVGCRAQFTVRLHVIIWTIHAHIYMPMFSWQLAGAFSRMFSFEAFGLWFVVGWLVGSSCYCPWVCLFVMGPCRLSLF